MHPRRRGGGSPPPTIIPVGAPPEVVLVGGAPPRQKKKAALLGGPLAAPPRTYVVLFLARGAPKATVAAGGGRWPWAHFFSPQPPATGGSQAPSSPRPALGQQQPEVKFGPAGRAPPRAAGGRRREGAERRGGRRPAAPHAESVLSLSHLLTNRRAWGRGRPARSAVWPRPRGRSWGRREAGSTLVRGPPAVHPLPRGVDSPPPPAGGGWRESEEAVAGPFRVVASRGGLGGPQTPCRPAATVAGGASGDRAARRGM